MKRKILIVDDHQLFGEGLMALINKQDDFVSFGPYKEKEEILKQITEVRPHVVLLDVNLGKFDGLELARQLKKDCPFLKVIMLTMYERENIFKRSIEYGTDGYLLKDYDSELLLRGIRNVIAGGTCFFEFTEKPESVYEDKDKFTLQYDLSERETEIVKHLKEGKSTSVIAKELNLSYHTVKTHRKNIYTKLEINSLSQLHNLIK